jgi:hypothetical protein
MQSLNTYYDGTDLSAAEKVFVEEVEKVHGELCLAVLNKERGDKNWERHISEGGEWLRDRDYPLPSYRFADKTIWYSAVHNKDGTILDFIKVFGESHPAKKEPERCIRVYLEYETRTVMLVQDHAPQPPTEVTVSFGELPALISELEKVKEQNHD